MDFKEEWNWLNSYQMEAVTDENDACIVNANVGSGKTTVLIAKILYLHYEKRIRQMVDGYCKVYHYSRYT